MIEYYQRTTVDEYSHKERQFIMIQEIQRTYTC